MSGRYATPLRLEFRRPAWWVLALGLLQVLALVIVFWLPLAWSWRLLLLSLWSLSAVHNLRACTVRRLVRAVWQEGAAWRLWFADGREVAARLEPGACFRHGSLLQLRLRQEQGRRLPLLILPGMLHGETLRRLKVRLRLFAGDQ